LYNYIGSLVPHGVITSELLVLTRDILGVMISKEQNSEITKSSSNLPIGGVEV
jgi:hypothetical protein